MPGAGGSACVSVDRRCADSGPSRACPLARYGGGSSTGGAPGCDPGGRGFDPRPSPQLPAASRRIRPDAMALRNIAGMTDTRDDPLDLLLTAAGGSWDPRMPEHHGSDHEYIAPGRRVAHLPGFSWPSTPENCTAGHLDTVWVLDEQLLLCTGCGLDGT